VLPAAQSSTTAGSEAAGSLRHGTGVDSRDLPAMLRVARLPEEAVDHAKMEFPGTYNRKGQLIEDAVEAIDGREEGSGSDSAEESEDTEAVEPLDLLSEEFPFLREG